MSRGMRGVWLWGALALTLAVGCGRKQEASPAQVSPPASAQTRAPLAPALVQACASVEPVSTNPSWRGGTLVVAGGAQGSAQVPGSAGEQALVVVQNGDSKGLNGVQTAQVTLNGAPVLTLAPGTPSAVRRVVLGSTNLLEVSATGGGEVRTSVAALTNLPCMLTDMVAQAGSPSPEEISFSRKSEDTVGILMVDLTGEDTTAEVLLNGVDVLANVPAVERRMFTTAVSLLATGNTLKVTVQGSSGGSARAAVFDADSIPPSLTMHEPEPGAYVTTSPLRFSGTFGVDTKEIFVAGQTAWLVGHDGLRSDAPLVEGINGITTVIHDSCGNTARVCVPVVLDAASPVIALDNVTEGLVTQGPVSPMFSATGGEAPVVVTATLNDLPFQSGTELSLQGEYDLLVKAQDAQDRVAMKRIHFAIRTEPPNITVTGVEDGQVYPGPVFITAKTTSPYVEAFNVNLNGDAFKGEWVSEPNDYTLYIVARDAAYNYNVRLIRFSINPPPVLTLVSPPVGTVTSQSAVELVVRATDASPVADVKLGDTSLVHGADGNHRITVPLSEGSNILEVVAYGSRGATATLAVQVVRDTIKPTLNVTTPLDQAVVSTAAVTVEGTVTDETAVTLTVAGMPVTPDAQGAFSAQVPLVNGANTLTVTATDAAGNVQTVSRTVTRSSALPTLIVTDPPDGYVFTESSVTVRGEASVPNASGAPVVTVNNAPVVVHADGTFAHVLAVPVGDQTVVVRATAPDGAHVERTLLLHRRPTGSDAGVPPGQDGGTQPSQDGGTQDGGSTPGDAGPSIDLDGGAPDPQPAPTLVVTSPDDGAVLGGARFAVSGQVEGGELPLQVTVNGFAAAVTGRYFNASLGLLEGPQTVTVEVKDARGRVASAVRQVTVDRTLPSLFITEPSTSPATVTQSPFLLKGTAGDANLARVTVGGVAATLVAGHFAMPLSLHAGTNTFEVVAEDLAGNRRVRTQVLNISSVPPQVTVLSPADGTEAASGEIDVRVQVSGGTAPVTVAIGSLPATQVSPGIYALRVALALGMNTIEARATDASGMVGVASVGVRYRDVGQEPLAVSGVAPVSGATGVETDALVSVSFNKPVDAATVASHFEVRARGVKLQGGYSVAPGGQTVTFIAREALPAGERVYVSVRDAEAAQGPDQSAAFASEFTVRRPLTVVRGVVLDERQFPLPGVKVEVEGQSGQSTRTGPDGNWALMGVRGGQQLVVRYEGGATSDGRSLPTVRRRLFVTAEQETQDRPLMLFPVEGASAQPVNGVTGGTLTFNGAQDALRMVIPAGGLSFADGAMEGVLTVTEVPPHGRPVPMEDRAGVAALWQLGPERVRFLKPVTLTLPNRTKLEAGRMVVVVAFDEGRLALKRVGFAHVVDEATIESDEPVAASSFEFFGYMEVTPDQQVKVEEALARSGGTPGGGTQGGGGGATDGGLGLRSPRPKSPSLWQEVAEFVLGKAHAQALLGLVPLGLSAMDAFPGGMAHAWGVVRAPAEDETRLELKAPVEATLGKAVEVELPYTQSIGFVARHEANAALSEPKGELVTASLLGTAPDGTPLAPGAGATWISQHPDEATLATTVALVPGTTTLLLRGMTRFDTRTLELKATLTPLPEDGGVGGRRATLVIQRSEVSSEGEADPLHGAARFQGVRVDITSVVDTAAMTGESGKYSTLVQIPAPNTQSIACADIPLGPRFVARLDAEGNTRFDSVGSSFSSCSPMFWLYPGGTTRADVLVDVRLLHGAIRFKQKDGQPLPAVCSNVSQTQRDPKTGEVLRLSEADVATTEVHFFREGDLEHPLARYAVTRPSVQTCPNPEQPPVASQGQYSRLRLGPTSSVSRATRTRCEQLLAQGAKTVEERLFLKNECTDSNSAFLRLSEGDRLVVFAINHATGYAGMSTVTVPAINRGTRVDGKCPADANGPLVIQEGTTSYPISHCTQQELGIPGDVDLYPPEIDVRVQRRAQDEGGARAAKQHLIRTGGAGTTRDDYVQVVTRWRVRRQRQLPAEPGPQSPDGGVAQTDCVRGLQPDGGSCAPALLTDDDADAGVPLEMYCSELPVGATPLQLSSCLTDDQELTDVPAGVPPLAGQVVRVTGSAVEQPAVTTFAVAPGQHTVHVSASLRRVNANGKPEVVNSLLRANYYLHVVGSRLLERDQDGDGWVSRSEDVAKPPHFEEPSPRPQGYPAGLPAQAVVLKNVFKRYDAKGALTDQYDVAREHEFRIIDLTPMKVEATGDGSTRDLTKEDRPEARERDLAYDFLAHLLEPEEPGRAGTLSGDYRVRLGSDAFGIDCPLKVNAQAHSIVANCGGEYIAEVLSASDILYLELYLSGNAENVLYRFNLYGLASRKDVLAASTEHLSEASIEPDAADGTAAIGRQVGRPAMSTFFVEPEDLSGSVLKLCRTPGCEGGQGNLLKEALLSRGVDGAVQVTETARGSVRERLQLSDAPSATGARRFQLALPSDMASMPGNARPAQEVFMVLESATASLAPGERTVTALGKPSGSYNAANSRAVGQASVAGISASDGHLSFSHEDFSVPFLGGAFGFSRTYNNQDNDYAPLGLGWHHNFEGYVREERFGRYVAVVNGQAYSFPGCQTPANPAQWGNANTCKTDNTHGFTLTVDAPVEVPGNDQVVLTTSRGERFEFNHRAKGADDEGKRRWLLTRFGDSHARGDDKGWTKVDYAPSSDLVSSVTRKGETAQVQLSLGYEPVDVQGPDVSPLLRMMVRSQGFQWLKTVSLSGGAGGTYTVTFTRDGMGNLTRAVRTPGVPYLIYTYEYEAVPQSVGATERWAVLNELSVARLVHGQSEEAAGPVQWSAHYLRQSAGVPHPHVFAREVVSGVMETGMENGALTMTYGAGGKRSVTRPDAVQVDMQLNTSNNVSSSQTPVGRTEQKWPSDVRGQAVVVDRTESPTGRVLNMTSDMRLRLTDAVLTKGALESLPVEGLGTDRKLFHLELDEQLGLPFQSTVKVGTGSATITSPFSATGDLMSMTLANNEGAKPVFQAQAYDADGQLLTFTDAQGRTIQNEDFNGLGQAQQTVMTLPDATGLGTLTRRQYFDTYGRLTRSEEVETGVYEAWTYDGLGRVRTLERSGSPAEKWAYSYFASESPAGIPILRVVETLEQAPAQPPALDIGTTSAHERTLTYVDGKLQSESVHVGQSPVRIATTTHAYDNTGRLTSTTDPTGRVRVNEYDAAGRLQRVTVNNITETEYTLDAEGRPRVIKDALKRETRIAYDEVGRAVAWDYGDGDTESVTLDAQGNTVRRVIGGTGNHVLSLTQLDAMGRPKKTDSVRTDGAVHEVREYDPAGRLKRVEDTELGLVEELDYSDVLGRLTRMKRTVQTSGNRALTQVETRAYDDAQHLVTVTRVIDTGTGAPRTETQTQLMDTAGRVLETRRQVGTHHAVDVYRYTERGDVYWHQSPTMAVTRSIYDPSGQLLSVVDPEGHTKTYAYDNAGRLEVEKGPHPGYQSTLTYDPLGRPLSRTVAAHGTTPQIHWDYGYLPDTHETVETAVLGDGRSIVTKRRLNARDRLAKESVEGGTAYREVTVAWEGPWEKSREVTEGTGWTATTTYDSRDDRGRVLEQEEAWASGGLSYRYETSTVWTKRKSTTTSVDRVGTRVDTRSRETELDSLGNVVSLKQGTYTDVWDYDAAGVLAKAQPAGLPATTYAYANGLLETATFGTEPPTSYTYDAAGRVESQTYPDGRTAQTFYNPRGLKSLVKYGRPGAWDSTVYTYDANGEVATVTSGVEVAGQGHPWTYARGARGELLGAQHDVVGEFKYEYDGLLRLTKVTPPAGSPTAVQTFGYDALGRQTSRTRGTSTWLTTWAGGVSTQVDANQDTVVTLMDGRGRPTRVAYQPGPSSAATTELTAVSLAYTAADQPWRVEETRGTQTLANIYTYDARRLLSRQERGTDAVGFTYTPSGQRLTVVSPAGTVTYGYDPLGRLATALSPTGTTEFEWETGGSRLLSVKGGGLVERRCYESGGRLQAVLNATGDAPCSVLATAGGLKSLFEYTYDARGNRLTEDYRDAPGGTVKRTEYGYDDADRLTGVKYEDGRAVLYKLAADGTRLAEKETAPGYAGALSPSAFNGAVAQRHWRYALDSRGGLEGIFNELEPNPDLQRLATYVTDAVGRVKSEQRAGGRKDYGWDAAGRLTKVTLVPEVAGEGGSVTTQYRYGWDGLRVARTTGAQTATYQWAGGALVEERLAGQPSLLYVQGGGMTVAVGPERVAHDGMGSAVGRYTATSLGSRLWYDAWGNYRDGTAPASTQASLGYTGHAWDEEVGLSYAQQRWLDTATGRFLSEDPMGAVSYLQVPAGLQSWGYANGNPLRYTDPTGRMFSEGGVREQLFYDANREIRARCAAGSVADCRFLKAHVALTAGYPAAVAVEAAAAVAVGRAVLAAVGSIGAVSIIDNVLQCSSIRRDVFGVDDDSEDPCFDVALDAALVAGGYVKGWGRQAVERFLTQASSNAGQNVVAVEKIAVQSARGLESSSSSIANSSTGGRRVETQAAWAGENYVVGAHLEGEVLQSRRPQVLLPPAEPGQSHAALDAQLDLATSKIPGLERPQASLILEEAFGKNSTVVIGGSRVRGNFGPKSDLDVGFGGLNSKQIEQVVKKADAVGPLVLEKTRIFPGNKTKNIEKIRSPEEFFQRTGVRASLDPKAGQIYTPSGSYTFSPDGSVVYWPPWAVGVP
jgi:large repetitive protein